MDRLINVLTERDGLSEQEAQSLIDECKKDFYNRLEAGEMPFDIMGEHFGLEPDYLEELIF